MAWRRDWIVLFAAHLCVCQAGLMACWPQLSLGVFYFRTQWILHYKDLCQSGRLWWTPLSIQIKQVKLHSIHFNLVNTCNKIRRPRHQDVASSERLLSLHACKRWWKKNHHTMIISGQTNCKRPCHRRHRWHGAIITCSMSPQPFNASAVMTMFCVSSAASSWEVSLRCRSAPVSAETHFHIAPQGIVIKFHNYFGDLNSSGLAKTMGN